MGSINRGLPHECTQEQLLRYLLLNYLPMISFPRPALSLAAQNAQGEEKDWHGIADLYHNIILFVIPLLGIAATL